MQTKTKSQLKRDNAKLQAQLTKLQLNTGINKHTKEYIHIRRVLISKHRLLALLCMCGAVFMSVVNFMLIQFTWAGLKLGDLSEEYLKHWGQLLILYPIIGEYIFIIAILISLVALIKGGFSRLKPYNEEGLIEGLLLGLLLGLLAGLIAGLLVGLLAGLLVGLLAGLLWGLLWGLLLGLIGGLL